MRVDVRSEYPRNYVRKCVETLRASYKHLAPTGRLVIYGFATMLPRGGAKGRPRWGKLAVDWLRTPRFDPLSMTNENKSVLAFNLSYLFDRPDLMTEGMTALAAWVEEGRLSAPRTEIFPLARAAEAYDRMMSEKARFPVVLTTGA